MQPFHDSVSLRIMASNPEINNMSNKYPKYLSFLIICHFASFHEQNPAGWERTCARAEVIILLLFRSLSWVYNGSNREHAQACFQSVSQM